MLLCLAFGLQGRYIYRCDSLVLVLRARTYKLDREASDTYTYTHYRLSINIHFQWNNQPVVVSTQNINDFQSMYMYRYLWQF